MDEDELISGQECWAVASPHNAQVWPRKSAQKCMWRWLDIGGGGLRLIKVRCYPGSPDVPRRNLVEVAEPGTALFSGDWIVEAQNAPERPQNGRGGDLGLDPTPDWAR